MKTSACIFCKGTPVTREDMISRWILRMFEGELIAKESKIAVKGRSGTTSWESSRAGRHTVKCVCASCNGGWMSDIEQDAKPALASMIRGESITLDKVQQEAVATWACLKTMIGAYAWGIHPIPDDWLEYFYHEHLPPGGWIIMTARYIGSMLQMFDSYRFGAHPASGDEAVLADAEHQNILASLIIGNLAISVRATRDEIDLNVRTSLLPLWPSSSLELLWPPAALITDANLGNFRQMGVKTGPTLLEP